MPPSAFLIRPYRTKHGWFFTDPALGVIHEPLVGGTDALLDMIVERHGEISTVRFSDVAPAGWQPQAHVAKIVRPGDPEYGGTWYRASWPRRWVFWLCDVLKLYFPTPPRMLWFHVMVKAAENTEATHESR